MLYAFDGKQPVVGPRTYVSDVARVIGDVVIGGHCYIGHGAILRGDYGRIEIGDGTAIEEGVIVHAPPDDVNRIGEAVTVGHAAVVHGKSIGDHAVIGMGAVISIGADIGEWTIVAEGSVVTRKQCIPPRMVAGGNPAKILRALTEEDQAFWKWGKRIYMDLSKKYLDSGMKPIADR